MLNNLTRAVAAVAVVAASAALYTDTHINKNPLHVVIVVVDFSSILITNVIHTHWTVDE